MKQKDVIRSSENSLEHNPAQINETLTGHVRGFGLSIAPVAGDGVSNLLTATSPHADIVNHLNSMGLSADMAITELARALRALIVEEWTGPNAEEYMNFIEEDVDFNLMSNNVLKGLITSVEYSRFTQDSTYLNRWNLWHEVGLTSLFRSPQKQQLLIQFSTQFSRRGATNELSINHCK